LLRTQAEFEKLRARVIQGEIDRDNERSKVVDLPALPLRKGLN
jgi:hypothetical protein